MSGMACSPEFEMIRGQLVLLAPGVRGDAKIQQVLSKYVSDLCGLLLMWTLFMWAGEDRMTIRVHLADDHTMFRDGLEAVLASGGAGIVVVGSSSTGEKRP